MVIYTLLYVVTYVLHALYFSVNVVFYSALFDAFIAVILTFFILKTRYFSVFGNFDKILILIIVTLLGYAISISIPTIIDRSLSLYMLEKINQRGGGIVLSSFDDIIKNEYMKEYRVTDARITEQLESGTIKISNSCVKLTDRGELIVLFSSLFRNNLLPKNRLLMGSYTDDLINPLRGTDNTVVDYKCK